MSSGMSPGMSSGRRVLVRGGGVAGLACAVALAEAGAAVTLAEAGPAIGSGASWKAGGMLAPWCEAETAPAGLVEMALPSLDWWRRQVPDTRFAGTLVLAPGRAGAGGARVARRPPRPRPRAAAGGGGGEPTLENRFGRALFFADEAHLDPRRALPALADRLRALGGTVLTGKPGMPAGRFDAMVDCRGHAARDALPTLRGVRGEMLLLRAPGIALSRPVRLLHPRTPVYVVPRDDDLFMVGATMIESEDRGQPRLRSMTELMGAAYALHPGFAEAEIMEIAADLRPAFGDNMPRIQCADGVLHVNGMFRHGFLLAPVLAGRVVETISRQGLRP